MSVGDTPCEMMRESLLLTCESTTCEGLETEGVSVSFVAVESRLIELALAKCWSMATRGVTLDSSTTSDNSSLIKESSFSFLMTEVMLERLVLFELALLWKGFPEMSDKMELELWFLRFIAKTGGGVARDKEL